MSEPAARAGAPTILAVDDRVENHAALREALKGMDVRILEAMSGREALATLLRERPAVILMDVNMPEMDGFETARLIHGNPATAAVPIIFLTASDPDQSMTFTGYAAGAVDYLHKPIIPAILRSKVRVFLDLRERQRALERALDELEDLNHNLERRVHERALALRESERRFSVAMQQSPTGMAIVSLQGELLEVNKSLAEMLGYRPDELVGRTVDELVHVEDREEEVGLTSDVLAGNTRGFEHEGRLVHRNGQSIWTRVGVALVRNEEGDPHYFVAQYRNITESRLARAAAEAVATQLVKLEGTPYRETIARCVADILEAEIGFVAEPVPGAPGVVRTAALIENDEVAPELSYELAGTPCADAVRDGSCVVTRGVQRRYPKDEYLATKSAQAYAAVSFSDPEGAVLGHVGVICSRPFFVAAEGVERVLTVFAQAAAASLVRERERERFVRLFELAPDALIKVDAEGRIQLVNRTAEELFGWPREELFGQPVEVLVPLGARKPHARLREGFAAEGGQRAMGANIPDLRAVRRDGSEFAVEISLAAIDTADGRSVIASVRDMTERDQLEGQLRQAQKMESVGRLAAGVAHDFNNVLSVINTTAELALGATVDRGVKEDLQVIRDAAQEAANLTGQLLALSRRQVMRAKLTDMNEVVRKAEPLVQRALGGNIAFVTRLQDGLPSVLVDPGLFQQVIMNLAVNARDAIAGKGTVTIETCTVLLDETYERSHVGVSTGVHVMISVNDTGSGMDRKTQERIFEPFFTTKAPGKGTGLGMSTVYGIVKQVNGDIRVYSELGVGTTFKIYIPVADDVQQAEAATESSVPAPHDGDADEGAGTRVLVVDDDAKVVRSVRRILQRAGFEVITAGSPKEALALLEAGDLDTIDLLVSDVVMPEMNGQELADRIRERAPHAKVLFSSGYTGETIAQSGLLKGGFELISKPYSVQDFTRRVRRLLGAADVEGDAHEA